MRWTGEYLYTRILEKDASFDGRVLTGVLTTGIYCLPSCTARKPLRENVRFFPDEAAAKAAGLRPCKRCHPDRYYREEDPDLARLEEVLLAAAAAPEAFSSVTALAEGMAIGATKLKFLFRTHVHTTPAAFLQGVRIRAACLRLAEDAEALSELGYGVGFESASGFHGAFRRQTGLSPGTYRTMLETGQFTLNLPSEFRVDDLLRFHGRDGQSVSERVEGTTLRKAYLSEGRPAVLSLAFEGSRVAVALEGGSGSRRAMVEAHGAALRLLGWQGDPRAFEAAHPDLARGRNGLRIPLTLDPFEALVWAILGQQVNLAFAYALRRDLIRLAGLPAGHGLIAHPDAEHLARLAPEALQGLRFSRRKAEYMIGAATQVAGGHLRLDRLPTATGAARALLALRGCGVWTAQYVLMRGLGFGDCVPVGDAGLTLALQRTLNLPERPDAAATVRLMAPFAPHRSLATFHLWTSLKGVPA
jgi:AraC family transcriptional regulator of adaptative response / DNA-3-methyladenine glycosylase II